MKRPTEQPDLFAPRAGRAPLSPLPVTGEVIVDSFAGGGGASLGISWALGRGPDIAINHDAEAIALHAANHPESRHYLEDVWKVDPVEACEGRPVGLMWLSPDCKHFSKAKGGKPVSKKVRGLAWVAVRWAVAVRPRVIVLENVEEFQTWGPVSRETNRPDPERRGHTFRRFCGRLRRLGYAVEWRELRACDYGAPTTRKRLFLVARCDGAPITWPTPTHGKGRGAPWRTAAECIDWSLPCPSIFLSREEGAAVGAKRPLADATMRRIARGVKRYVLDAAEPFIVGLGGRMGQSPERPVSRPLQTITAKADSAVVAPYLVPLTHQGEGRGSSMGAPAPTVTGAHRGEQAIVAPLLVPRYGEREGQEPRALTVDAPMPTVVPTQNGASLVSAFLAKHYGGHETPGSSLKRPADTITTQDHHHLVAAHLSTYYGDKSAEGDGRGQQLRDPLATQTTENRHALVRAFLISYYGTDQNPLLTNPTPTIPTHDRLGLVTVHGQLYEIADIGMRMLVPRELYRAQGFPDSYRIDIRFGSGLLSKTAQVKMCGNSVCPPLAEAIVRANFAEIRPAERVA